MITEHGLHFYAEKITKETKTARLTYEDGPPIIREVLDKEVVGAKINISFVLDAGDNGKIKKIELLDGKGEVLIDQPFLFLKNDEYNVWVSFQLTLREEYYGQRQYHNLSYLDV